MPFLKHKKGTVGGITAYLLFGIFILLANLAFYITRDMGFISNEDWLDGTIMSTLFMFGGMIIYYIVSNNLFNQGKQAGMLQVGE